jgi:hypothetical protein
MFHFGSGRALPESEIGIRNERIPNRNSESERTDSEAEFGICRRESEAELADLGVQGVQLLRLASSGSCAFFSAADLLYSSVSTSYASQMNLCVCGTGVTNSKEGGCK